MVKELDSRSQAFFITALLALAGCVLLFAYIMFSFLPDSRITINDQKVDVIVADSPNERTRGLSGRERLAEREGMLFSFSDENEYCIWMKDMNFSIDAIWLDADQKVIDIKTNISPNTYPETFCPKKPAKYILEVNAGSAQNWQIDLGDKAEL